MQLMPENGCEGVSCRRELGIICSLCLVYEKKRKKKSYKYLFSRHFWIKQVCRSAVWRARDIRACMQMSVVVFRSGTQGEETQRTSPFILLLRAINLRFPVMERSGSQA